MQIHQLSVAKKQTRKRIGRGGKRGTTSGRGTKGQKARTGAPVDPLFEGVHSTFLDRLKKTRGFKSIHPKKYLLKLSDLERAFPDGENVTLLSLIEKKLVPKDAASKGVKILANGTLNKKFTLDKGILLSKKAGENFQK